MGKVRGVVSTIHATHSDQKGMVWRMCGDSVVE